MNYEQARTTLASMIQAAVSDQAGLVVEWDNLQIDINATANLYLRVEYVWDDAGQITLGEQPLHRTTGSVFLTLLAKDGTGPSGVTKLMSTLTDRLKWRNESGLVTRVPTPGRRQRRDGWMSQELHLPFYFDSST